MERSLEHLAIVFAVLLRIVVLSLLVHAFAGCAPCEDEVWNLDLVEVSVSGSPGRDCGHVEWVRLTVIDPCGAPIIAEDPERWDCRLEAGEVVCDSTVGIDVLDIQLTVGRDYAVLDFDDGACVYTFGPRP